MGRQWLASIGKTDNGVVSVTSLWAAERVYWPVAYEPYTPAHHFERGKSDPACRTKLKLALGLVEGAVLADSFYGEDEGFKAGLRQLQLG